MARPRFHVLLTAPATWYAARKWGALAAAGTVLAGVFIDADHLVDHLWTRLRGERSHYIAPLHGWELAAVASLVGVWGLRDRHPYASLPDRKVAERRTGVRLTRGEIGAASAGLALGWWIHLLQDLATNRPEHVGAYTLLYRASRRFERFRTGWGSHPNFHEWSDKPWYTWF